MKRIFKRSHDEDRIFHVRREVKKTRHYDSIETDKRKPLPCGDQQVKGKHVSGIKQKKPLFLKKDEHKKGSKRFHPESRSSRDSQQHPAMEISTSRYSTSINSSVFLDSLSGSVPNKHLSKKPTKGKGNRTGQRERQRLWDEMYGIKAKHHVRKKSSAKRANKAKEQGKGEQGGRGSKIKCVEPSLHPSWEASKKKKELESKIVEFQGQRTTFSDSD